MIKKTPFSYRDHSLIWVRSNFDLRRLLTNYYVQLKIDYL